MLPYYEQAGSRNFDLSRKDRTAPLSSILERLVEKRFSKRQDKFGKVMEVWREILPDQLYQHCKIKSVENGVLKVKVDSPVYANELKWAADGLIEQLKEKCPKARIRQIKCSPGR